MRTALISTLFVLAACGGGTTNEVPDAGYDCATETRAETFTAGMSKVGSQGMVTFKLMSSTPAPPGRGNDTWEIDLVDSGGAPVTGAAVTVTPFMPDHNHGTSIKAQVTEPTPGHYVAAPVNFWMVGFYQITVKATPSGGNPDAAVFNFCIPG